MTNSIQSEIPVRVASTIVLLSLVFSNSVDAQPPTPPIPNIPKPGIPQPNFGGPSSVQSQINKAQQDSQRRLEEVRKRSEQARKASQARMEAARKRNQAQLDALNQNGIPNSTPPVSSIPNITTPNITTPNISTPNITTPNFTIPNSTIPQIPGTAGGREYYECSSCKKEVSASATRCPHCNIRFDYVEEVDGSRRSLNKGSTAIGIVVAVLVIGGSFLRRRFR
jgi:hypothetical protein